MNGQDRPEVELSLESDVSVEKDTKSLVTINLCSATWSGMLLLGSGFCLGQVEKFLTNSSKITTTIPFTPLRYLAEAWSDGERLALIPALIIAISVQPILRKADRVVISTVVAGLVALTPAILAIFIGQAIINKYYMIIDFLAAAGAVAFFAKDNLLPIDHSKKLTVKKRKVPTSLKYFRDNASHIAMFAALVIFGLVLHSGQSENVK